ncbi:MAG: HIT family protein [Patescibacteria group bacterium]|jgi:histidine triad (HIT) family protein
MAADCIFCKIIAGEIPAAKVYEDDKVLAFLDINPVNYGHVLLIPKEHYRMMADTPDELVAYIFTKAKELMKVIKIALKADFVVVSVVGVDVPHFHVHLVPRFKDDGLAGFGPTKKYGENEMAEYAEKIKGSL